MEENKKTSVIGKTPKKNLRYQRDKDREKVKGIFHFYEVPGGVLDFVLKLYKEDQPERYVLRDGEIVTIPLGVAKHLNKSGWYPIHKHAVDADGRTVYKVGERKQRYGFQSLEFVDPDDFQTADKSIITVENV